MWGKATHLKGGRPLPPRVGCVCVYILILPTQNAAIFNNFLLEKEAFATIIYRKKTPSIGLSKS